MRVTFITTKINFERAGGSVPDLDLKVRDMQALGAEVRVVTVFSEHNLLPDDLPYPVSEERTPSKSLPALQRRVLQVLRKYERDTDVFHIEGQFAYAAGWYRLLGGKPIVAFYNREMLVWERGGARRAMRRLIEKLLYRSVVPRIDRFIFTTPQLYACYRDFGLRVPDSKISIMLDFFDAEKIRARALPRESTERLRVFASGRMVREKGFHLLIEALALLPEALRDTLEVTIGGKGPEEEVLAREARKRGVSIHFPGWISKEEFWKRLATADIFVLPRWRIEQPSVIVMEALALGIPIIAPGGGGVEWMAQDAIHPFRNDDASSLADALGAVAESDVERARLETATRERVPKIDHFASRDRLFSIISSVAP